MVPKHRLEETECSRREWWGNGAVLKGHRESETVVGGKNEEKATEAKTAKSITRMQIRPLRCLASICSSFSPFPPPLPTLYLFNGLNRC
jgi:hypothetical protein